MNPDGSGKTRLTFGKAGDVNADPCFAPNGDIYYIHSENYSSHFDLWKMNGDGGDKALFFAHNSLILAVNDPTVSPHGHNIVFEGKIGYSSGNPIYNIFAVDSSGENLLRITADDGESDIWPSYSPDESYIVYFTYHWDENGGHTQKIRVAKADGSGENEISSFPWESFPSWFKG